MTTHVCACVRVRLQRRLPTTLWAALGDAAWRIMPRSFALPEDLPALRQAMAANLPPPLQQQPHNGGGDSAAAAAGLHLHRPGLHALPISGARPAEEHGNVSAPVGPVNALFGSMQPSGQSGLEGGVAQQGGSVSGELKEELWVLKTAQHLGKGLKLVPASQLVEVASRRCVQAGARSAADAGCTWQGCSGRQSSVCRLVITMQLVQDASRMHVQAIRAVCACWCRLQVCRHAYGSGSHVVNEDLGGKLPSTKEAGCLFWW